ncbi:Na+:solute symporter [candidate division KSB1 bacterium]|nr:Na+:solute symporter [candidate division KSB1 bacterium]
MRFHPIDLIIIAIYMVSMVLIGFLVQRRAGQNMDAYFLGSKSLPWYLLGVANASSMFDITGTMWLVYILFVYGLKGVWLPWLWPTFNQVFLMIYLAVWIRRSNVMTGAEWITTRFGSGRGGELSRLSVLIFALISVIGFLGYDFQGIGKFSEVFLPWKLSPHLYAAILMGITTIYVITGGMYSVVITDLVQFTLMTIACIFIAIIAMNRISAETIAAITPHGWDQIFFGWRLNLDWSNLLPSVNPKIAADGWSFFTIIFMMMLFKGILVSMAGPAPNYDMQRVLATRRPRESAFMSGIVSLCLFPRWLMIAGITVIALVFYVPEMQKMGAEIDFEKILPYVVNNFIPVGLLGLLVAGLLAAFMSTFDATVNAGASYVVNDLYKRYVNPKASEKTYIKASYLASIVLVIIGMIAGVMAESINTIMQWIVSGLWGGYTTPNILKWYWWRFNGYGYFWGMVAGIAAALLFPVFLPTLSALNSFPFIILISGVVSIVVSLLTPPEEEQTLKNFYMNVRPWGFWKPIYEKVIQAHPTFKKNTAFSRDMLNIGVGIIWQMTLVVIPVYLVIKKFAPMWLAILILIVTSVFLKFNWIDKLERD